LPVTPSNLNKGKSVLCGASGTDVPLCDPRCCGLRSFAPRSSRLSRGHSASEWGRVMKSYLRPPRRRGGDILSAVIRSSLPVSENRRSNAPTVADSGADAFRSARSGRTTSFADCGSELNWLVPFRPKADLPSYTAKVRWAQLPDIRGRPGERASSDPLPPFRIGPMNGRLARQSGPWLKASIARGPIVRTQTANALV
jgi:hypothetical protein